MLVVVDTNVLRADIALSKPAMRALLHFARTGKYEIRIPGLVLDEALNLVREDVHNAATDLRRARRRLQPIADSATAPQFAYELTQHDADELVAQYEARLGSVFGSEAVSKMGYPSTPHKAVAGRALRREPPFDDRGKDGYRDTILWEAIVEEVSRSGEDVVLISSDKVFRGEDGGLHSILRQEIAPLPSGTVELATTVEAFIDEYVVPDLDVLDVDADLPPGVSLAKLESEISSALRSRLDSSIDRRQLEVDGLDDEGIFEDLALGALDDFGSPMITAARELSETELLIEIEVSALATIEAFVTKQNWYGLADPDFHIWDSDWNEWYVLGDLVKWVEMSVDITFDTDAVRVTSIGLGEMWVRP